MGGWLSVGCYSEVTATLCCKAVVVGHAPPGNCVQRISEPISSNAVEIYESCNVSMQTAAIGSPKRVFRRGFHVTELADGVVHCPERFQASLVAMHEMLLFMFPFKLRRTSIKSHTLCSPPSVPKKQVPPVGRCLQLINPA